MNREEALKSLDDIFNYCEEIDYSLPENERSGYNMLPDIQKIRKYIMGNTQPHGAKKCPKCGSDLYEYCFMCCFEGEEVRKI